MKFFEKKQIFLILLFLAVVSCVKDNSKETLFLDKMEGIVWTRGRNFKSFESNPFKLFIVEDGICIEFKEGNTLVQENKFSYSLEKNSPDTLVLGYRVTGEKINHCGTFTYYLDSEENLVRTYVECNMSIYSTPQMISYYKAEKTFDQVCLD